MKIACTAAVLTIMAASGAYAQSTAVTVNGYRVSSSCLCQTVSANFQLSEPASNTASTFELADTMASVTKALYEIVNRQCDVLGASLNGTCQVSQVNVNANINSAIAGRGPSVNASANARFEIVPKPATVTPGPQLPPAAGPSPQ